MASDERTLGALTEAMQGMKASVERIEKSLEKYNEKQDTRIKELEEEVKKLKDRVQALENYKWILLGGASVMGFLFSNWEKLFKLLKGTP